MADRDHMSFASECAPLGGRRASRSAAAADQARSAVSVDVAEIDLSGISLPPDLVRVLQDAFDLLAQGRRPQVYAASDEMLTTQAAAGELGVSRPHLVKLLDAGQMEFQRTSDNPGAHRRISRTALENYKTRRARAEDAMRAMSEIDQELDA